MILAPQAEARVPFHGAQLLARKEGDNIFVAVKPICDHLGIDYATQYKKLVQDGKFNCWLMPMVAEDGRQREMFAIERRDLAGWLYGINVKKVGQGLPPEQRERLQGILTAYQRESTDVLHDHWAGRTVSAPALPAPEIDPLVMAQRYVEAETERRTLTRELAAAQPKVEAFHALMDADGTYSMAEVAKIIGRPDLGPLNLFELLRERGILMTGGEKHNLPYQQYLTAGYFKVRAGERPSSGGGTKPTSTTRVTPKGLHWICKNVLKIPPPAPRLDFSA